MKKIVVAGLLCSTFVLGSSVSFAQDAANTESINIEALSDKLRSVESDDVSEIVELRNAVDAMTAEAIGRNDKLQGRRDLISGGYDSYLPRAFANGQVIELKSTIKTAGGAAALAIVKTAFKYCDHPQTTLDDQIRFVAGFEGANYMSSGLNWDVITVGQDVNNMIAFYELALGTMLLKTYFSNKAPDGGPQSESSSINSFGTRVCAPLTALSSLGMGLVRAINPSNAQEFVTFKDTVVREAKELVE